jgi:hypothetical protein
MNDLVERLVLLIVILLIFVAGYLSGWVAFGDDNPTGEVGTPEWITRELHCEEDEDIVITLGSNNLPYAFCEQVIER